MVSRRRDRKIALVLLKDLFFAAHHLCAIHDSKWAAFLLTSGHQGLSIATHGWTKDNCRASKKIFDSHGRG
jgi:hypothetical protein